VSKLPSANLMTTRKFLGLLLTTFLLVPCSIAEAQQVVKKIYLIGILSAGASDQGRDPLSQGLRELGWVEGKNIEFEYRYAGGQADRVSEIALELVRLGVDVIVTGSTLGVQALKRLTTTIPIVMAGTGDPVGTGLVLSLARPGGNVTGLSALSQDLSTKRLELLKEISPRVRRVAVLWNPDISMPVFAETKIAAQALGMQLDSLEVRNPSDIDSAFTAIVKKRPDALFPMRGDPVNQYRKQIAEFAANNRLPAVYASTDFADAGGLLAYGVSNADLYRRSATYVDKILKGTKPADLPVEQPMKFELIINLKAAKQIGLTIPPNVLVRADRVIR
jgi:putative ABC transport system substrate-binding protein